MRYIEEIKFKNLLKQEKENIDMLFPSKSALALFQRKALELILRNFYLYGASNEMDWMRKQLRKEIKKSKKKK